MSERRRIGILGGRFGPIHLGHLAGHPLKDNRVKLVIANIVDYISRNQSPADAILLDVDNGPTSTSNGGLYSEVGLASLRRALRPGGTLGIWSASVTPGFENRLRKAGFQPEVQPVRARWPVRSGGRHTLYFGHC